MRWRQKKIEVWYLLAVVVGYYVRDALPRLAVVVECK